MNSMIQFTVGLFSGQENETDIRCAVRCSVCLFVWFCLCFVVVVVINLIQDTVVWEDGN